MTTQHTRERGWMWTLGNAVHAAGCAAVTCVGVVLAAVLCAVLGAPAHAQTAPAGNAHPEARVVSAENKDLGSPFGQVQLPKDGAALTIVSPADKHAFAAQVNLEPLRGLAVFHNGRVKILDTLAKESIERISGRKRFQLPASFTSAANVHLQQHQSPGQAAQTTPTLTFDPLFTLLDMTIDPVFYVDKPLIGISYLPLRRELLDNHFPVKDDPKNAEKQEAWLRLGRVAPFMVDRWAPVIRQSHMGEAQYIDALNRTENSLVLFADGASNFVMVAPAASHLPWTHLAGLEAGSPARQAGLALGEAWRAMDAAKANEAIAALARELPAINASVYPTRERSVELFYNKLRAFEWGWVLYATSLVALLLAFGTGRRWIAWTGGALLVGAMLMHATGFVTRAIIAERYVIQNQFESMTGISLFAAMLALGLMIVRRQWLFGAAAAGVGFMTLVTATQTAIPGEYIEREAAILNTSVLLKYHVTIVLVSYSLIALGFITSLFYLATHYLHALKAREARADVVRAVPMPVLEALGEESEAAGKQRPTIYRTLADLDKATMIVLQLAFWTLGVGILLGAWWADHSWGRWWAFDPKETWALITWIIYLIVIHVRRAGLRDKGLTTAWLSVAGFVVMLWTYFGVNLLLPGLHAYA